MILSNFFGFLKTIKYGLSPILIKEIVPVKDLITELMKEAEMDLIGKI